MQPIDHSKVHLAHPEATKQAGAGLAATLYGPVTILLIGDLGTGKTTFLQGFAAALGVTGPVTSPTFALEQRYGTLHHGEFLHLDLYRLDEKKAQELVRTSDHHTGIRCIEWADRLTTLPENAITLKFSEEGNGRMIECTFADIAIPSSEQIVRWRKDVHLPAHIIRHCETVAEVAFEHAEKLTVSKHMLIRREALRAAAQVHDLFRFVDFRPSAKPQDHEPNPEDIRVWDNLREFYTGLRHEAACWKFLSTEGFPEVAQIVSTHGVHISPGAESTIEQKLLYYADKHVTEDKRVTLDERFADFTKRYGNGTATDEQKIWYDQAKALEKELFL